MIKNYLSLLFFKERSVFWEKEEEKNYSINKIAKAEEFICEERRYDRLKNSCKQINSFNFYFLFQG